MVSVQKKTVLFICTHNAARSQMAEGLLRHLYGTRYEVYSAGTEPSMVHPYAVRVMQEIGIDIAHQKAKSITKFSGSDFDYVVTVCDRARQVCPVFPGKGVRIHKSFFDPAATQGNEQEMLTAFRRSRDELRQWIETIFKEE